MDTNQIRCPKCNGANPPEASGQYECVYCLEPFSVQQAESEEKRLAAEIKDWMQKVVGAAANGKGSIDASSRAYIFGEKILPKLRREVDRALETLGSYGQYPLVLPPIDCDMGRGQNPLISQRPTILGLRSLQMRLDSPDVTSFAVTDEAILGLQQMDRRVADFLHLSNVANSAAARRSIGYRSARVNLEAVVKELDESLITAGSVDPDLAQFLGILKTRYRLLIDYARVCEDSCSPNAVSGVELASRLERVAGALTATARAVEGIDYNPADTMPLVIGMDLEASSAALMRRWMLAYDGMTSKVQISFLAFVAELRSLYSASASDYQQLCELVEGCAEVIRIARGEIAVGLDDDGQWIQSWVEQNRKKKTLWVFGIEEEVAELNEFLLPVWVADVRYSQSKGGMFAEGAEHTGLALVDACSPSSGGVLFIPSTSQDDVVGITSIRPIVGAQNLALPLSTRETVAPIMNSALKQRSDIGNAKVTVRGLAFVAAGVVQYSSEEGQRWEASALAGRLCTSPESRFQVQAAQQAIQRFN